MWLFRFLYSLFILGVFIALRETMGIDIYHSITYSIVIIFSIYFIESLFNDFKSYKLIGAAVGGVLFTGIAYLITLTFDTVFANEAIKLGFYFFTLYLGIILGLKSHWMFEALTLKMRTKQTKIVKYPAMPKVLDTSTLIDGRIADIVDASFMEGGLIIPTFVLKELQNIADSHDHLRRQKGRRGLNVLKRLQEQSIVPVEITETDFTDIGTVDEKLVALAKNLKAWIITTDFNLLKVAEIQNIRVLNMNTLAMAMRQNILPGEDFTITVVKEGKEHGQGVGYLDDGTMVVVDHGRKLIGDTVQVVVTSLLQTESGRIIFTKVKN
ncbi:PIN/TRAM domain-containing protein [Limisalsivibrio acetivorans]|uniref:PIN/TRAM domain-containing protein n=1 Tax=Limisalsivibrio acetivorans TaxID=1304888 RepID=UPI00041AE6EA|nr:TRAM domain-containing protein [Limisalsivibrio acetivorans]